MTNVNRRSAMETKHAMFRAALVAQSAGEPAMTASRIAASLLLTKSVSELCSRAQIDPARVRTELGDPAEPSFEECERRAQHSASIEYRPSEPAVRRVLDPMIERHGAIAVSPLELLLELVRADAALAQRFAAHGLDAKTIGAAMEKGGAS